MKFLVHRKYMVRKKCLANPLLAGKNESYKINPQQYQKYKTPKKKKRIKSKSRET
jgi:hypothetical protein